MTRKRMTARGLPALLWDKLVSVWGLGSENGEEEIVAVSEREFKRIAREALRSVTPVAAKGRKKR